MEATYEQNAKILKALADPSRLKIIDILSCGEVCACHILEHFEFTQPTLSHHMKILMECGLVSGRKEGTWMRYSLNIEDASRLLIFLGGLTTPTKECICNKKNKNR